MQVILRRPFLGMLLSCCALAAFTRAAPAQEAPAVTVANPLARRIALWDEYTGRFEALQRVEVRPRVSGYIDRIHFVDGAIVAKGDVLFTIDPRPYEIALDQARAEGWRNQAQVQQAAVDYSRAEELVQTAAAKVLDLDQRQATLDVDAPELLS